MCVLLADFLRESLALSAAKIAIPTQPGKWTLVRRYLEIERVPASAIGFAWTSTAAARMPASSTPVAAAAG
jgi:hypothetical protein